MEFFSNLSEWCKILCKVIIFLLLDIVKFWIYSYNCSIRLETIGAGICQFNFPTFFVLKFLEIVRIWYTI